MNITEFAAYAGVSKAAVSRYFNGGYLSAEKRQAIQKAVEETGYHLSESARPFRLHLVSYQGHVISVVIAVWFMSFLKKRLHKIVPEMIDLFVTPLVTVIVTGYLTLTIIGLVFSWLESGVLTAMQWLIALPFGVRRCPLRRAVCPNGGGRNPSYV